MNARFVHSLSLALLLLVGQAGAALADGSHLTLYPVDDTHFPKVRVPLSFATAEGVPIARLGPEAFEVLEDEQPVSGAQLETIVDSQTPVATALVLDTSGSMADDGKLTAARAAAAAFLDRVAPQDSTALVSFASTVSMLQEPTNDAAALKQHLDDLNAAGETALYDAVVVAAQREASQPQGRKVLLVLTDGDDNRSHVQRADSIRIANEAGVRIFAMGLGAEVNHEALDDLANATGGQAVYTSAADDLAQLFRSVGDQLRRQYVVQYTSHLPADGATHGLRIKATYLGQTVEARTSFTATRAPLGFEVPALTAGRLLTGKVRLEVTVTSGVPMSVELLVDGQSRDKATTQPFALTWDTSTDPPGQHRATVRVRDGSGTQLDREFAIQIGSGATPTALATPSGSRDLSPVPDTDPLSLRLAGLVILGLALLVLGGALLVRARRSRPVAASSGRVEPRSDNTEVVTDDSPALDEEATRFGLPPCVAPARLEIVEDGQSREVPLRQAPTVVGRAPTCEVVIHDPQASRRHAQVVLEGADYWVEDLKSMNGTLVNGQRVTRRRLVDNDRIGIGKVTLTFRADGVVADATMTARPASLSSR